MALSPKRRQRRRVIPSHECKFFKRENGQEHCFFGDPQKEAFFQQDHPAVQRKCEHCEAEEKEVHRAADKKEDKEVHRSHEKKEEEVHRAAEAKEEKEVHRAPEAKEDKEVHRAPEKDKEEHKSH
jgi:hypothetical protein